jgi:hypothetical protein
MRTAGTEAIQPLVYFLNELDSVHDLCLLP